MNIAVISSFQLWIYKEKISVILEEKLKEGATYMIREMEILRNIIANDLL